MLQRINPPDAPSRLFRSVACSLALLTGAAALHAAPPSIVQDKAQEKARTALKQPATEEPVVRLYFLSVPWAKVLQEVAEGTNSTLVMHDSPSGRYTRQDMRRYTRDQAVRILNSELEREGFRILEKDQFLTVIKAERSRVEFPRREYQPPAESGSSPSDAAAEITTPGADVRRRTSGAARTTQPKAPPVVRQAGFDEEAAPDQEPEATSAPETVTEVVRPQRQPASELALRLYSAFGSRAQLLPAQESGRSPGFMVFNTPAPPDSPPRSEQDMAFGIAVDNQRNELRVAGPADTIRTVAELLRRLDQLPAATGASGPRLVAMEQTKLGIAQRLGPQLKQIQTARRRMGGSEHATAATGRLLAQAAQPNAGQTQPEQAVPPETPGEFRQELPADREALLKILLEGLKSEVKMEVMPELNLLLLIGNEADVQKVVEIINAIEQLAIGTTPAVDVFFLQHVDSQSLATLLTTSYEQLGTLRSRTQGAGAATGASAAFVPVVKPNAVLILAPQTMLDEIHSLIGNLDQPIDPSTEVEVFFLKHAVATQVVTNLEDFYNARPGLGTKVLATADVRSNAVIVQAQPNDLTEIATLIRKIDKEGPDAVNQLQVFRLNNAIADEVADFLNALLQSVLSPPTGVAGAQQAVAAGGAGTQTTQILREPKAVVLEYVARNQNALGLVNSGVLQDERLVRSGLLSDIRVSADIRTNSLTVTAPEASMELMEELIRVLDQPSATVAEIKVFPLKNADATSAVTVLENIFAASQQQQQQQQQIGIQVAGAEGASSALIPLRFSADPRTNTVVAIGGVEVMDMVQGILLRLDESDPRNREIHVIRLKNSPADLAATAINQFLADQRALAQLDPDRISTSQLLQQEFIVTPDTVTNSLIISATPSYFPMIEKLATDLDREPQQVVIQALLVEVELNDTDEFGVELGFQDSLLFRRSILSSDDITTTTTTNTLQNGTQTSTTNIISQAGQPGFLFNNNPLGNNTATPGSGKVGTQGLANFALGRVNDSLGFGGLVLSASSESVSVLIRALAAHRTVNVLSRPMVLALDNQLAQVQVGQEVPRVEDITITNNVATPIVNYDSAGIILTVSPRISSDGQIVMEVAAEKSEYTGAGVPIFTDVNTGNVIESPIKDITNALTTVKVPDGQTVVVGGMITKREVHDERKVPWLGDIPIVGNAFRYDFRSSRRTELLIFLTPRIIHNDADSELIKEVEMGRIHFFIDQAEEVDGPLFGIPGPEQSAPATPPTGSDPPVLVPPLPGAPVPPPEKSSGAPGTGPQARLPGKPRVQQAGHIRVDSR